MNRIAKAFFESLRWQRSFAFLLLLLFLVLGCTTYQMSRLSQPVSEKVANAELFSEVPRGSVAILSPISWESAAHYYYVMRKSIRKHLKKHAKDYPLKESYLLTTWAEVIKDLGKAGVLPGVEKKSLNLYTLWTSIRRGIGHALLQRGFDLVPFREVDLAAREIMPDFWDEDSRTPEKVAFFCEKTKASYVATIETLHSYYFPFFWVSADAIIRIEVYNHKGESEFVGLASGKGSDTLQEAYARAIRTAMSQWLGESNDVVSRKHSSLEDYDGVIDGFWAAEGYRRPRFFTIPAGSKIIIVAHSAIPTVAAVTLVYFPSEVVSKSAKHLSDKLRNLLEKQGYQVTDANLLKELIGEENNSPVSSSYNRTAKKLAEIAKSSGAEYIVFCEIREEYRVLNGPESAVVFLKVVNMETEDAWTEILDEETDEIPKAIVTLVSS